MELTKEYFDEVVKNLATKQDLERFVTKEDLAYALKDFVTKKDLAVELAAQTKVLQEYVDDVAATILEAVDFGFRTVNSNLEQLHRLPYKS